MLATAAPGLAQVATPPPPVWMDVPFAAQTADGCGSASVSMIMRYWDIKDQQPIAPDADPVKIQALLFSHAAHGIYASSMEHYLRSSGYQVFAFSGEWRDLEHNLDLGRPLIVSLKASGSHGPLHYVVLVGIDSIRGFVYMNDPAQQKMLRISREGFESEWRPTRNWTLLAVPLAAGKSGH
ncbi:MAG TPA: C39 family peptidase [Acidobacteriaceae bacterium]|nr:C39 family peptidase [Acidobacteriaceae bacterium]